MRGVILGTSWYIRPPGHLSAQFHAQTDSIETPITILTESMDYAMINQQVVNSHSWTLAPANARHARMDTNSGGLPKIVLELILALVLAGKAKQGTRMVSAGEI